MTEAVPDALEAIAIIKIKGGKLPPKLAARGRRLINVHKNNNR